MRSPSNHPARFSAFTLVEVLLALGILALIASVMIISVTSLHRSTHSREGALRMETALRLARADAANTGKRLRMSFAKETGVLSVTWEADPINKPGQFTQYTAASWPAQLPTDMVTVKRCVRTGGDNTSDPAAGSDASDSSEAPGTAASSSEQATSQDEDPNRQSLTFYPDGSSDSAVIEMSTDTPDNTASTDSAVIELDGFSGNVTSRILSSQEMQERRQPAEAPDPQSRG
jgi:type II secretory pathway pseudopilin PulG